MKKSIENIVNHSEVSEKAIEAYLNKMAKEHGTLCLKYSSHNTTGYPDRILCLPYSGVAWIEIKSKGKKPTKLQTVRHEELRKIGHDVFVVDSKESVRALFERLFNETIIEKL